MPPGRPLDWPRVATNGLQSTQPATSHLVERSYSCTGTASSSSPRSPRGRGCFPRWTLGPRAFRRPSRHDDRGSATVVAAAMVAVLLAITGGVYLGSVVVARHRAQATADLAALAAAARLPAGREEACTRAAALAQRMRVDDTGCAVHDLDVVITVQVAVALGGWGKARAAARAGPA